MSGFLRMRSQLLDALREHLAKPSAMPRIPEAGIILWQAFIDLDSQRTFHANGPNPIALTEIAAWIRLKGYPLQPRHVEVLQALDAEMVAHLYARAEGRSGAAQPRRRQAMTPALFDARYAGR